MVHYDDVLRCDMYLIGDTNQCELDFSEFKRQDANTEVKKNETGNSGRNNFQEFMRERKCELTLSFPNLAKKEIHAMALAAYQETKIRPPTLKIIKKTTNKTVL